VTGRIVTTGLDAVDVSASIGDRPVFVPVTVHVDPGEWLTLSGPSGCGKSLLLETLGGVRKPHGGAVVFNGRPLTGDSLGPPEVGFMAQTNELLPTLTVSETVALPLQANAHALSVDIDAETIRWLGAVGMSAAMHQQVTQLSGGQRQRVAFARTMAGESRLLLLDEPTAELDEANRRLILDILRDRVRDGATLVVASNDLEVIEAGTKTLVLTAA
jgi:ABC-type lipoprotein export system ATPase subunit